MLLGKRPPVLLSSLLLGAAVFGLACGSSNNNKAATSAPAPANNSAPATTGAASPGATRAATIAPAGTAAAATRAAASATVAAGPPTDLAADAQQQVIINIAAEPQFLDPQKSNFQQDIEIEHLLWKGLFAFDQQTNTVPALATVLPSKDNGGISSDGLTYTIKMKPGQKFSDGTPLTAKDIEYSIKRMLDPTLGGEYASFFYDIKGAEALNTAKTPTPDQITQLQAAVGVRAVDDTTIQFVLIRPSGSFTTRLALWAAYPMEKAAIDKLGSNPMDAGNLIGNGPFILTEHVAKDHITLAPNPNYTLGAQPYLKKVTFRDIEDTNSALVAFQNGELQATLVPPQSFNQVSNDATLKTEIHREAAPSTFGLEFNQAQKPFDNPMVRMAFSRAIDRNQLAQVVFSGTGVPTSDWLPKGLPGYSEANLDIQKTDVAAAKQLLSQAGFANGAGLPDVKMLFVDSPTNQLLFQFLQQQLKQNLNVNVTADFVDAKTRSSRINSKDFQVIYGGWGQDYPNADDWLPIWTTKDTNNKYNYSDQKFDDAVTAALAEIDPAKQAPLWSAAEKILLNDAAIGVLRNGELLTVWSPKIKGITGSLQDQIFYGDWFLETAYVSK